MSILTFIDDFYKISFSSYILVMNRYFYESILSCLSLLTNCLILNIYYTTIKSFSRDYILWYFMGIGDFTVSIVLAKSRFIILLLLNLVLQSFESRKTVISALDAMQSPIAFYLSFLNWTLQGNGPLFHERKSFPLNTSCCTRNETNLLLGA